MNRIAFTALAFSLGLFACTNQDDKPSKSASAALGSVQNPTGSFDADNANDAFSSYSSDKKSSSPLQSAGGGSGGSGSSSTQALHILSGVQQSQCSEGSKCACPSGGSFTYQKQDSDYGPALSASFDSCVFDDGNGFTGDMLLLVSDKPLLKSDKADKADVGSDAASGQSMLLAADGTFTNGTDTIKADVVFLHERGVDYLAVEVKDGKVVIGVRESDGAAVVYAKDTTWLCQPGADGNYDCQEQSSGKKVSAAAPKS